MFFFALGWHCFSPQDEPSLPANLPRAEPPTEGEDPAIEAEDAPTNPPEEGRADVDTPEDTEAMNLDKVVGVEAMDIEKMAGTEEPAKVSVGSFTYLTYRHALLISSIGISRTSIFFIMPIDHRVLCFYHSRFVCMCI